MEEPVSGPSDEQTEPAEDDNGTPVIEDENEPADPPAETPAEEPIETPDEPAVPEEPVVTPEEPVVPEEPVEEEPVEEIGSTTMSVETVLAVTECTATAPTANNGEYTAALEGVDGDGKLQADTPLALTVTANTGYKVKSVNWAIDGIDQGALTEAEGKYTIPAATLTEKLASATTGAITFTVTTVEIFDVTVTVDTPANVTTLKSIIGSEEKDIVDNKVTVEKDTALSLKVVPAENFEATVKVDGTAKEGNNNIYEIGTITAATTVAITTAQIVNSYAVNETIKENGTEKTGDEAKALATIEYTADCVEVDAETQAKTIDKGKDLTFKVNEVPGAEGAAGSFDGKVVEVSYKIGSGTEKPLTKDANNVYKVEKTEIKDAVTIIVNVRDLADVTVAFTNVDTAKAKVSYKVADAAGEYVVLTANSATETIKEGKTFNLKVEPVDVYQIDKVTAKHGSNDAEPLKATDGVYSFVATKDNVVIGVVTSYDKTKVNSLAFAVSGDSDKDSYTVAKANIKDDEGTEIDDLNDPKEGTSYQIGETVLTKATKLNVTLTPDVSYDITKVMLGETTLYDATKEEYAEATAAGPYVIDYGATAVSAKTLTVTTKAKTFDKDITVSFTKGVNSTVVDYKVVESDTVVKNNDGSYTIKKGEAYLEFNVTTVGKYTPAVKVNNVAVDAPEKAEDGTYSYKYLVAKLNADEANAIVVDAQIAEKTVTLVYETAQVDVSATIGNAAQTPVSKVYTVNDGDTLSFKVAAKNNFEIEKVTTKGEAADAEVTEVKLTNGRFDLKVEENTTVTITAKGVASQKELIDKATGEAPAKDKTGAYIVSNTGTYVGGAVEGSADVTIDSVKLYDSKNKEIAATSGEGDSAVTNWSASANKAEITLYPTTAIAGQKLTLKMFKQVAKVDAEGNPVVEEGVPVKEDKEVAVYKLAVAAKLDATKVKVSPIKQATDTYAEYPVSVNAGAEVSKVMLDLAETDGDIVKKDATELVDGKLKVTTGFKAGETKIKLYVLKDETAADTAENRTVIEVSVTTTALIDKDTTKAPKVTLASATDVSMVLTLDASALKLKDTATGAVYYEIKAKVNGEVPMNETTKLLKEEVIKYVEKTADKQNAELWFNASGAADKSAYGTGGPCKYDVEVKLVHLKNATEPASEADCASKLAVPEKSYSASASTGAKPFATKAPYYEDNLKLKKGTTTVYTGQTAVIATPQFGKNTSYMVVDSGKDLSADGAAALEITVDSDTNEVKAKATSNTTLGKHNIQVVAMTTGDKENEVGVPTMYASRATIAVTVVRGIQELRVEVPSDTLYKAPDPKKGATMTASVIYNNGATDKNLVPKAKKVDWVLLNKDNKVLSQTDYLNGKLTIKNGKVTLAKEYDVSRTETDNQFKIAAIAADFNRNVDTRPGTALSASEGNVAISDPITITNDAISIGSLAILDSTTNEVIARDGETIEASKADDATLVAFIPGAPVKTQYTEADLTNYAAKASNVKFTSANAKAVTVDAEGVLHVVKPAKNVTLSAAPGDGNPDKKAKQSMKVTIDYDTTGELGLQITKVNPDGSEVTFGAENKAPEFTDSAVAYFELQVQQKGSDGEWDNVADSANFTNYKLAVKGGKLLYNENDGTAEIATASAVTTITLTNNVRPAVKIDYVLTNKGISEVAKSTKAPKVKITGSLRADYPYQQSLKVQLTNQVKEDKPEYIKDFSKLYVKVDFDWTTYNTKKPEAQDAFVEQMNPKEYLQVEKDGSFYLGFVPGCEGNLVAGSYKIKINFGEIDEDGNFKSMAPAAAQTIKVGKPKKLSFKATTSYSISATDNGYAVLTGKGTYDNVTFSKLQNANIKGKENNFLRYFKIKSITNAQGAVVGQKLCLTENYYTDVNNDVKLDFSDKKFKDDLTGYVTYTASDLSGNTVTNTVKLTLKVSAPKATITKYSLSTSGVVGTAAGSKVRIYVVDNKKQPVAMAAALYGDNKDTPVWDGVFGGNRIELTAKAALTEPKYEIPITFLPASSYYAAEYEKIKNDNTKNTKFVQDYGITLTAKVTAKDLATVNKGRIKIDSKKLSQTFTPYYYDGESYCTYVDYDEVYAGTVINKITNNSLTLGSGDSAPQLIKIERDSETIEGRVVWYNTFKVSMNKALFSQAIKADTKNTFYDNKGKAKTLTVKADVCYDAAGTQKDSFTFKLTMPEKAPVYTDQGEGGLSDYEQAVDVLNQNKAAIENNVEVAYYWDNANSVYVCDTEGATLDLYLEIVKVVGFDSGIDFDTSTLVPGVVEEPTTAANGSLPITATLKGYAPGQTTTIGFELKIPKMETAPSDVATGVTAFLADAENTAKYSVNTVTQADILTDLRAYMPTWAADETPAIDVSNIRYKINDFNVSKAKFDASGNPAAGSVTGKVVIWNIHMGENSKQEVEINYTIAAPVAEDAVIDTVKTALGIATEDGESNVAATIAELAVANVKEEVKEDVLAVAQKAAGFAYTVEYKDDTAESFDFTPVTATTDGSIKFTLVVKDSAGNFIGTKDGDTITPDEITLAATTLTKNENIMTVAEAETAVTAWVTKVTGDSATDEEKAVLTTAEDAAAAATAIATAAGVKSTVTLTVTDWGKKAATFNEDGYVRGTIVLSKGGSTNKKEAKVAFELILAKTDAWTMDNAETVVKAAVENANIYISNTNVKTDAGKAAVAAQMLAAAKAAVPETKFTVAIKQTGEPAADVKLVVADATVGTPGKVTLVLVVTQAAASSTNEDPAPAPATREVTVEHEIPALPEGSSTPDPVDPEEKEITSTLTDAIKTAVTTAISDATSPILIKADTQWLAISDRILAAANSADGLGDDFEVVAANANQLVIEGTATINLVVRQKNLITNKWDIAITGIELTADDV